MALELPLQVHDIRIIFSEAAIARTQNHMEIVKALSLKNGLNLRFINRSRRYYDDYYNVRIEVECDVPVFLAEAADVKPSTLSGPNLTYRRNIEKMGVPSAEVSSVICLLIDQFEQNALSYLAAPSFPVKFIRTELAKMEKHLGRKGSTCPF
ncbi:hypothetical protein [Geobacter sp. DSM 9736]|uniref:hypothetical protein n=1 Tax=Geobacter sp. DSM 9736 TaxID=1277350 RepID=UPI000B61EBCB|nr:hypothetical protein [Geobacter sp. DSM 9736]SNB45608.1 hypothetical protein SAMN06269301_1033 [Geobacter sp. DSM 9736]